MRKVFLIVSLGCLAIISLWGFGLWSWPASAASPTPTLSGKIGAEFETTANGSFQYTIDIRLPPAGGRSEPHLALAYNSQGGTSLMGVGWDLTGFSNISRCPATPAQDGYLGTIGFDASDRLCLDGHRLVPIGTTAGASFTTDAARAAAYGKNGTIYRTEIETWRMVVSNGDCTAGSCTFDSWTADGAHQQYGQTTDSSFPGLNGLQRLWAINQQTDRQGNFTQFTYSPAAQSGNAVYPLTLRYGGHQTGTTVDQQPTRTVSFAYQTRPDVISRFSSGAEVTLNQRLTSITVTGTDQNRSYQYLLSYVTGSNGLQSQVQAVTVCGPDAQCLPSDQFSYGIDRPITAPAFGAAGTIAIGNTAPLVQTGDVDGDGRTDMLLLTTNGGASICADNANVGLILGSTLALSCPPGVSSIGAGALVSLRDVNGDGRADLIVVWPEGSAQACPNIGAIGVLYSNGSGFGNLQCLGNLKSGFASTLAFANTTGTSFPDLILWNATVTNASCTANQIVVLRSSGTSTSTPLDTITCVTLGSVGQISGLITADLNGDGLADLLVQTTAASLATCQNGSQTGLQAFLSAGAGNYTATCLTVPGFSNTQQAVDWLNLQQVLAQDVNGDRLDDLILMAPQVMTNCGTSNFAMLVSTGTGFQAPVCLPTLNSATSSVMAAGDLNGDGLLDLVRQPAAADPCASSGQFAAYYATGSGFTAAQCVLKVANIATAPLIAGDFDGNGLADLATLGSGAGGPCAAQSLCYQLQQAPAATAQAIATASLPDLLASVQNGINGQVTIGYGMMVDPQLYTAGSPSWQYPQRADVTAVPLVAQVTRANGLGASYSQSFAYAGAALDLSGRGWLGFGSLVRTDQQAQTQQTRTFNQLFPYTGTVNTLTTQCTGAPTSFDPACRNTPALLAQVVYGGADPVNGYGCVDLDQNPCTGTTRNFVVNLMQKTTNAYEYGSKLYSTQLTYRYDQYGQRLVESDLGDPSIPDSVVYRCFTPLYPSNLQQNWLIGYISEVLVSSTADCATPLRDTKLIPTTDGLYNVGSAQRWDNSGAQPRWLTTSYQFDAYGNVTQEAGPDVTLNTAFDAATNTYPVSVAMVRGGGLSPLTRSFSFDDLFGAAIGSTDPNGNLTVSCLDPVGRPLSWQGPAPAGQTASDPSCQPALAAGPLVTLAQHQRGLDPTNGFYVTSMARPNWGPVAAGWSQAQVFTDGLERDWRTVASFLNADNSNPTTQTVTFSPQGQVASQTVPATASEVSRATSMVYDAYNRVITQTAEDGSVLTIAYGARSDGGIGRAKTVTYVDGTPTPQRVTYNLDTRDRLANVVFTDPAGTSFSTVYTYDLLNRPTQITTADLTVWRSYDSLDRLLTDRAGSSTPTSYAYNAAGLLETVGDQAGTLTYGYDALGRATSIAASPASGSSGQTVSLSYDEAGHANGLGQLTTLAIAPLLAQGSDQASIAYGYDAYGRIASTGETLGGQTYATAYQYTPAEQVSSISYPDNSVMAFSYYLNGLAQQAAYSVSSAATSPLAAIGYGSYTGEGRILSATLQGASTVQRSTSYQPTTGLLASRQAGTAAAPAGLENLSFAFDPRARLSTITDSAKVGGVDASQSFTYDTLNRLQTATGPYGALTYAFSDSGALTLKDGISYTNTGDQLSQGQGPGGASVGAAFDADGRLSTLSYGGNTLSFAYDPFGRLSSMALGGVTQGQYGYGLGGDRLIKVAGGATTVYTASGYAETVTNGAVTSTLKYFPEGAGVGGYLLTQNGTTSARFLLKDQLDSVTQVLDDTGAVLSLWNYDPYGRASAVIGGSGAPVGPIFAGIPQDPESGLLFAVNRYYDPRTGRFLTPDPALGADPGSPAAINRYAYVSGNPVTSVDPLGLFDVPVLGNIADIAFMAVDLVQMIRSPSIGNALAYIADGLAAIVPGMPDGSGTMIRVGAHAAEKARVLEKGLNAAHAAADTRAIGGVSRAGAEIDRAEARAGVQGSCGCFSFAAGTPVAVGNGQSRPIESLRVGDRVLSGTRDGRHPGQSEIAALHRHDACDLVRLETARGPIQVTAGHRFLVQRPGEAVWTEAARLTPGDSLIALDGGSGTVTGVEPQQGCQPVYNFTALPFHTYAVGNEYFLTENGKYCTVEYDATTQTVTETWNSANIEEKFNHDQTAINDVIADIKNKNNRLNAIIANRYKKYISPVQNKVKTASKEYVKAELETMVAAKKVSLSKPISKVKVREGLDIIRPLMSKLKQDVDEIWPRGLGGETIKQGHPENQMPLISFVNSTQGAALGNLAKKNPTIIIKHISLVFQ